MADVFLSYAREDHAIAAEVAAQITACGLTVWWDRRLVAGHHLYVTIEAEIAKSRKVVVLWSQASTNSGWVLSEAQEGADLQKLCPVRVDDCKIPMGFRHLHSAELLDVQNQMREFLVSLGLLERTMEPASPSLSSPRPVPFPQDVPPAALHECDVFAGDPDDPDHVGAGVKEEDLEPSKAIAACHAAIRTQPGISRFKYQLARALIKNGDERGALPWMSAAAESGHREALVQLGMARAYGSFNAGHGVIPKDGHEAMTHWEKAAAMGSGLAMYSLGHALAEGQIVARDTLKALAWLTKAFDSGFHHAAGRIGDLHANGIGMSVDFAEALRWYRRAASLTSFSCRRSGPAFEGGAGHPIDRVFAIDFLTVCAEAGNTDAMDALAERTGDQSWYRRALTTLQAKADAGDANAMFYLGLKYESGTGAPKDDREAQRWFKRAADNGSEFSAVCVGKSLIRNASSDADYREAAQWLERGAAGHADEYVHLARLFDAGMGVPRDPQAALDYLFRALDADGHYAKSAFVSGFTSAWTLDLSHKWSDDIKRLAKAALKKRGYYAGEIAGEFDKAAIEASRHMILDKGLTP